MRKYKTVTCNSCEVVVVNNHICHEIGCPDAWQDEIRECKFCGIKFKPEERYQTCCGEDCQQAYYNQP